MGLTTSGSLLEAQFKNAENEKEGKQPLGNLEELHFVVESLTV